MTLIKTGITVIALAASLGALATSASAQTRAERIAAAHEARAEQRIPQQRYVPFGNYEFNSQFPNHCRTDDGYGRYDTCDH